MEQDSSNHSILQDRYLIAILGNKKVAFPANLVWDILTIERSQILVLPFYDPVCLGVVHYQNQIVPLVSTSQILGTTKSKLLRSTLTAVRLNDSAANLAGVALVVDSMEKTLAAEDLSHEHKFQVTDIPAQIWQPQP